MSREYSRERALVISAGSLIISQLPRCDRPVPHLAFVLEALRTPVPPDDNKSLIRSVSFFLGFHQLHRFFLHTILLQREILPATGRCNQSLSLSLCLYCLPPLPSSPSLVLRFAKFSGDPKWEGVGRCFSETEGETIPR